jgi:hypothetical protein
MEFCNWHFFDQCAYSILAIPRANITRLQRQRRKEEKPERTIIMALLARVSLSCAWRGDDDDRRAAASIVIPTTTERRSSRRPHYDRHVQGGRREPLYQRRSVPSAQDIGVFIPLIVFPATALFGRTRFGVPNRTVVVYDRTNRFVTSDARLQLTHIQNSCSTHP